MALLFIMASTTDAPDMPDASQESSPLLDAGSKSDDTTPTLRDAPPSISSLKAAMRRLFCHRLFVVWFIFKMVYFAQVFAVGLFVPLYAAEWFGGCLEADQMTPIAGCSPDYTQYAFWSTLFFSIGGLITLLSSPLVGHLRDTHGRKPFFFLAVLTWMVPRLVMIFRVDFFIYFALSLLTALNGGDFFIASKGYLADIVSDHDDRVMGYGFGQSAVGIGCILGSLLTISIATRWNDHAVFIALSVLYVALLLYVHFLIKEPTRRSRPSRSGLTLNPFRYLSAVCAV